MKIICPNHKDTNPSCEIYEDGMYCFVCGYRARLDEKYTLVGIQKAKTDIKKELDYIDSLPKRQIRGLLLPYDESGYFIVWPDRSYYFKRMFSGEPRYIYPSGHKVPVFNIIGTDINNLIIIEGVINAISLSYSIGRKYNIVSPGSCNMFNNCILYTPKYSIVSVVVDKDVAGVINGLKLKEELIKAGKRVYLIAKETDYNQTLQDKGSKGLKEEAYRDLGLSRGL